jgi:hypothetical protein
MEGSFDLTGGRANHCELYDELSSELRFANLQNSFRRVEFFEATLLGFNSEPEDDNDLHDEQPDHEAQNTPDTVRFEQQIGRAHV